MPELLQRLNAHFFAAVDRRDGHAMRYWRSHIRHLSCLINSRCSYSVDGC